MPSSTKKKKGRRRRAAHPSDLKPNGKRRSIIWRWRRGLFLVGLLFVAGIAAAGYSLAQIKLPPERIQAQTSFICAADVSTNCNDSNAIASLHGEQDRVNVTLDQVPQVLVDAVLAAEDRTFFDHGGVDPWGTARALWADLRNKGSTQGGSTITQQYVKNVYLSSERTFSRKIKEAVLSIKLEQEFTKQEILQRYLNTVYFGRGAYGIGAAVRTYFGHDLSKVTLPEAAYLAGLIRSPETADGAKPTQVNEATVRRRSVLQAMLETKKIDQAQFNAADKTPFTPGQEGDPNATILVRPPDQKGFGPVKRADIGTEYFRDYVVQQLKQHGFDEARLFGGGLRIYTTLDLNLQQAAFDAVNTTLTSPDDPLAALVSLDPDGHIKAMIGGKDHATDENNYAVPGLGRQWATRGLVVQAVRPGHRDEAGHLVAVAVRLTESDRYPEGRQRARVDREQRRAEQRDPEPHRCDQGVVEHGVRTTDDQGRVSERDPRRARHGHHDGSSPSQLTRARHG